MKKEFGKKAALEMSVGTMVTLVLLMVFLVLGIFFIQKIIGVGVNAVDTIDSQVQSELQKLFSSEDTRVAFYPKSRDITVKKGDTPKGFAFQLRNIDVESQAFTYRTMATDTSDCGSTFNEEDANAMLLGGSGTINIGPGDISEGQLVRFNVPETAPPCTMEYRFEVDKGTTAYTGLNFFLTIK